MSNTEMKDFSGESSVPTSANHRSHKVRLILAGVMLALLMLFALVCFVRDSGPSCNPQGNTQGNTQGSRVTKSLRFVIVMTRHGIRAPLMAFPTFPYPVDDKRYWPQGPGQLTSKGLRLMHSVGKVLRRMYHGFLEDYSGDIFKVTSTASDRTLMSAQVLLAGLFPPTRSQSWDDRLPWPVPIYTTTLDHSDYFMRPINKECPRYATLAKEFDVKFNEEYKQNLTELYQYILPHIGTNSNALFRTFDPLKFADLAGLPLPAWTAKVYPEPLTTMMGKYEAAMTLGSTEFIRLFQGPLYQEMVGLMRSKANHSLSPDRKMYYHSGHDTTLRTISGILGYHMKIVNPGTALVLELHEDPEYNNHYVEVLYMDGGSEKLEPALVNIPGCGPPCPLEDLLDITEKYYNITDYDAECNKS